MLFALMMVLAQVGIEDGGEISVAIGSDAVELATVSGGLVDGNLGSRSAPPRLGYDLSGILPDIPVVGPPASAPRMVSEPGRSEAVRAFEQTTAITQALAREP
jgi:hypothetical protein